MQSQRPAFTRSKLKAKVDAVSGISDAIAAQLAALNEQLQQLQDDLEEELDKSSESDAPAVGASGYSSSPGACSPAPRRSEDEDNEHDPSQGSAPATQSLSSSHKRPAETIPTTPLTPRKVHKAHILQNPSSLRFLARAAPKAGGSSNRKPPMMTTGRRKVLSPVDTLADKTAASALPKGDRYRVEAQMTTASPEAEQGITSRGFSLPGEPSSEVEIFSGPASDSSVFVMWPKIVSLDDFP